MPTLMRVAPELPVKDMGASLRHYEEKIGFQVVMMMPDGDYAIVERDGVALHLFRDDAGSQSPASVHVFVAGLDELHAELLARQGFYARLYASQFRGQPQPSAHASNEFDATIGNVLKHVV